MEGQVVELVDRWMAACMGDIKNRQTFMHKISVNPISGDSTATM
jgi:hypothetical protein